MEEQRKAMIRARNARDIALYEQDISALTDRTQERHLANLTFFLEEIMERGYGAADGVRLFPRFMQDVFLTKTPLPKEQDVRDMCTCVRRFYAMLARRRRVDGQDARILQETIREKLPVWIACVQEEKTE